MLLHRVGTGRFWGIIGCAVCLLLLLTQCGGSTSADGVNKFSINIPGELTLVSEDGVTVSCRFDSKTELDQNCTVSGDTKREVRYWPRQFDADGMEGFIMTLQDKQDGPVMNPSDEVFRIYRMKRKGFANIETSWSRDT